jgi:hypothetical protein
MTKERAITMDSHVRRAFEGILGKPCCSQRVGRGRSLSIGFGARVQNTRPGATDPQYCEWEVGTYSSAWRLVRGDQVLCGSMDVVDSIEELSEYLQGVQLGNVTSIEALSPLEIRISLDNDVVVDFICVSNDDDEMFHIFGPEALYVEYKCLEGWFVGKSDVPWKD